MFRIRRILVIDDDEMMRDLLHALLPMDGYEVSSVEGGEQALHALGEDLGFDLVLMDCQMPGIEGKDLVEALRSAMPPHALLTGMSGSTPVQPVLEALDSFLLKPFDTEALQQAITDAQTGASRGTAATPGDSDATAQGTLDETALGPLDATIFDSLTRLIPLHQLGDLYELTLKDIGKRLERIRSAVSAGDLHAARREAHAIKGSCGMVGAAELQFLAAAIEDGTTANTSAIAQIPLACLRLRRMLDAKLQPV